MQAFARSNIIDQIIIFFHTLFIGFQGSRIYEMEEKIVYFIIVYGCYEK